MNKQGGILPALVGLTGCIAVVAIVFLVLAVELGSRLDTEISKGQHEGGSESSTKPDGKNGLPSGENGDQTDRVKLADTGAEGDGNKSQEVKPEAESGESTTQPKDEPKADEPKNEPKNEPKKEPPWADVLADPNEPPRFSDICFDDFDTSKAIPLQKDLDKWFERIPGKPGNISTAKSKLGPCGAFTGLLRLKSPWGEDTALRLSLENYNQLRIHIFCGQKGVTLAYYENEHYRWAAYPTTRGESAATPETFALTGTDDGRNRRTEIRFGGPFEIRYRAGEIVLSRGDIVLLRAPLDGLPDEVNFEGKAYFHGISLVRDREFPSPPPQIPPTIDYDKPADLEWESSLTDKASFSKDSDGSVTLTAENADQRGWVATKLPADGIYEAVLQIDDAAPGTGVFLGGPDGNIHEFIRFVENSRDKSLCVRRCANDDLWQIDLGAINERLVARAAPRMWIRLLYACGSLKWWISSDGVHWAETHDAPQQTSGNTSHVGIHHVARRAGCRLTLSHLSFHRFDQLAEVVAEADLKRAPTIPDAPSIAAWLVSVSEQLPEDMEMSTWRRACALRTLAAGCSRQLGFDLVNRLLDDAASSDMPAEARLDLLDEVTRLLSIRDDQSSLNLCIKRYHDVGKDVYDRDEQLPYSLIRKRLLEASFSERLNLRVADPELVRIELLQLLYAARWQETIDFCRRLRFYQQHQQIPLVPWAETVAQQELPVQFSGESLVRRRDQWRHVYEEALSKRTYNVLAELNALLDGEAYDDAARMIASIDPTSVSGVAPLSQDRRLLVSLPAAIRLSVDEHSQLMQALVSQFGPLAELRVQQAIAAGDVEGVRLAAIQFGATPAAAEAHRWLGDRALSGGWFAQAVAEFRRAEKVAGPALKAELTTRIRLASAMLGQDVGDPVSANVNIGQFKMTGAEFESVIQDMLKREAGAANTLGTSNPGHQIPDSLPEPAGLKPYTRARLDGAVGQQPNAEILRHVRRYLVPWVGRQIATAREGDMLYVSNRFQVAAYDLNNGQRKWQSQNPPGNMLRSQEWSLTPMEPLIVGDRIFARLMFDKGPMLVCLNKSSGQRIWSTPQRQNEFLVTDPMVIQNQLCCLSLDRSDSNRQVVRLNVIAHESGEVLRQEELLQLRSSWWQRQYCRALALDDSMVTSFGGVTACFDLNGDLRWIRKQVNVPTEEEPTWVQQYFDSPRLFNGRLYIAEPSVRAIECVDPRTGRLIWSRTLPGIRRVISIDEDLLVTEVDEGLLALDTNDGQIRWRKHVEGLLHGVVASRDGRILIGRKAPISGNLNQFIPHLTWINSESGKTIGETQLDSFGESPDPRFGPLLENKGRLWVFFGKGHDDPNRDFVELVPEGKANVVSNDRVATDLWAAHVPNELQIPSFKEFSPWNLISGVGGNQTGLLKDFHGENGVIVINANQAAPVVFGRRIQIPKDGTPKLRLRVGHPPGIDWELEVRAGPKVVQTINLEKKFPKQTWSDLEVDLSDLRGRLVWLSIHGLGVNPAATVATLWKRIELVN